MVRLLHHPLEVCTDGLDMGARLLQDGQACLPRLNRFPARLQRVPPRLLVLLVQLFFFVLLFLLLGRQVLAATHGVAVSVHPAHRGGAGDGDRTVESNIRIRLLPFLGSA